MPRPADPPQAQPLPSERLRVGDCLVDVPLREVRAPGKRRPLRITPKSMGVLLVLVEQAGRVVSRDALMTEVWPDTLPTNDVVTQAITQLRKAFDDERGNPRYIETIAKNGYRLLAPIEWLYAEGAPADASVASTDARWADPARTTAQYPAVASSDDPAEPLTPVPFPHTHAAQARGTWRSILAATIAVTVLVGSLILWSWLRERSAPATAEDHAAAQSALRNPRPFRLITSMPGFEISPTLSPDAGMVAYVAIPDGQRGTSVLVQTTEQTQPRLLTRPPAGADDTAPAWSPDGRWVAFVRLTPDSCSVRVVTPNARAEREVGACDPKSPPTFDWTPDSQGLIFGGVVSERGSTGLRVLELSSGAWRDLDYGRESADLDVAPRYSPDGQWIVFVRNAPLGDFWRVPVRGGKPERLSHLRADVRGWDWLPGNEGLVFGGMVDGETRLFRLNLETGLTSSMGLEDAVTPVVARSRRAMAFVQRRPYFGLYRIELGAEHRSGSVHVVEPLFPSSSRDWLPTVAPDDRQLVFVSDRSGSNGLWWADLKQPDSLRMIGGVSPVTRYAPAWSGDSRRLLVTSVDIDGQSTVQEVVPASGRVVRLAVPLSDPLQAQYVPEANRLLVLSANADGHPQLNLFDRTRQPWLQLAQIDDVSNFRVDAGRNRVLFTRLTQSGLWQANLDLAAGSVQRVDVDQPTPERYRLWALSADGEVRYVEQLQGCAASLRLIQPDNGAPPRCLDQTRRSAINGFSLGGPRGEVAYLALAEWDGADIGYMDLPEEPKAAVSGWFN